MMRIVDIIIFYRTSLLLLLAAPTCIIIIFYRTSLLLLLAAPTCIIIIFYRTSLLLLLAAPTCIIIIFYRTSLLLLLAAPTCIILQLLQQTQFSSIQFVHGLHLLFFRCNRWLSCPGWHISASVFLFCCSDGIDGSHIPVDTSLPRSSSFVVPLESMALMSRLTHLCLSLHLLLFRWNRWLSCPGWYISASVSSSSSPRWHHLQSLSPTYSWSRLLTSPNHLNLAFYCRPTCIPTNLFAETLYSCTRANMIWRLSR